MSRYFAKVSLYFAKVSRYLAEVSRYFAKVYHNDVLSEPCGADTRGTQASGRGMSHTNPRENVLLGRCLWDTLARSLT